MSYIALPDGTVSFVPQTDDKGNQLSVLEIIEQLRELVDGYKSN